MIRIIRLLFTSALIAYLVYLLVSLISFVIFEHSDIVIFFKSHCASAYRIDEYGEKLFTPDHYQFVGYCAIPLAFFFIVLIFLLLSRRQLIETWLAELITDCVTIKDIVISSIKNLTSNEKLFLFICIVLIGMLKVYFFQVLPFHVDEAFNFIYFAEKGIFHSTIFPNNHTLINIISAMWWRTGLSPEVSMRLTSVVSSLVVHILIYSITVHYFKFRTGIFVLMLSGVTFWGNVYAVEGVAYMLMTLWVVLSLIAVFSMGENSKQGMPLFVVSSVLGFYTSQLFIIPFIALMIFWIGSSWYRQQLRTDGMRIAVTVGLIAIVTALLYFPMYLWSGFEAAFHAAIVRDDLFQMLPELFDGFSVMTDLNTKSYLALAGLVIFGMFYFRQAEARIKSLIALQCSIVTSILLFSLITGTYPPSRGLIFANILLYCSIGVIVADIIIRHFGNQKSIAVLVFLLFMKGMASVYIFNAGWQHLRAGLQDQLFYEKVSSLSTRLLRNKPALIFADRRDTYLNFYLMLEAIRNRHRVEFTYDSTRIEEADLAIFIKERADRKGDYEEVNDKEFGRILIKNKR